jgi:hypothetical protein
VSTNAVAPLFSGLVDDAAVFPPGLAPLPEAVVAHRRHRDAWYSPLVGPLLVPATMLAGELPAALSDQPPVLGLVGDAGLDRLGPLALRLAGRGLRLRQIEAPVAKRGEDPLPGVGQLVTLGRDLPSRSDLPGLQLYAEIPLTGGLMGALDALARARSGGVPIAPKFRTGGLAAELFPTPADLARVIIGCRDRGLPFKLTAGLHRAIRHDPETGFVHHGFLNILAACVAAADQGGHDAVRHLLTSTDPVPLIEAVRGHQQRERPLWTGFGSCSIREPIEDLQSLGLLT